MLSQINKIWMARMNRKNRPIPIQTCLKIVFIKKQQKWRFYFRRRNVARYYYLRSEYSRFILHMRYALIVVAHNEQSAKFATSNSVRLTKSGFSIKHNVGAFAGRTPSKLENTETRCASLPFLSVSSIVEKNRNAGIYSSAVVVVAVARNVMHSRRIIEPSFPTWLTAASSSTVKI